LAAVLSIGDGAERFARQQIERGGCRTVAIVARTTDTVDGLQVPRTDVTVFTPDDLRDLAAFVSRDTEWSCRTRAGHVDRGGQERRALVLGIAAANVRQLGLHSGAGACSHGGA